jgi:hypothetical protein
MRPFWAKVWSKVKAYGMRSRSMTAKLMASVEETSLS